MPRALVTGGSGFIGGHVVEALLARAWQVRCLVRSERAAEQLRMFGAQTVTANLLSVDELTPLVRDVDVVFHIAGLIAAVRPSDFQKVNAGGTECLAQACAASARPPTLVLVSSIAAAGPTSRAGERTEVEESRPVSVYGRSKLAGEEAARRVSDRVPTTIVRPGVVFGPRDRSALSIFKTIKLSGVHPFPRVWTPPLTLIHIHDLVSVLIAAAERGQRVCPSGAIGQGVYFAGRREHPTYCEFGRLVAQSLGRRWFLPLPLVPPIPFIVGGSSQLVARLRGVSSIVNLDKMREATVASWACSSAQAERDLGLQPQLSLLEQLRDTVAWYRAERWL